MHRLKQDLGKCQGKEGVVSSEAVPFVFCRPADAEQPGGTKGARLGPTVASPSALRPELGGSPPTLSRPSLGCNPETGAKGGANYAESLLSRANSTSRQNSCTKWVVGRCARGHTHARAIFCGREWCPTCGEVGSDLHKRRQSKWLPRVAEAESWRYLVITLPPEVRVRFRTKAALAILRTKIMRKLQRMGCARGLDRWHFFGEPPASGIPEYHPHLNILTPGGFMPRADVLELKQFVAKVLKVELDRINLKVAYAKTWTKLAHRVRYITRSTFLDAAWDVELSRELVGFRNGHSWGKWTGESVWPVELVGEDLSKGYAVLMYERGLCPDCGTRILWEEVLRELDARTWRDRGGGYWSLRKYGLVAKAA